MANSQGSHQSYNKTKRWVSASGLFSFIFLIFYASSTFIIHWIDLSKITGTTIFKTIEVFNTNTNNNNKQSQFPLDCNNEPSSPAATCPTSYPTTFEPINEVSAAGTTCPDYFKWIQEDLKPWEKTGITREMIERGQNLSHFRLVVVNGKAYVEKYAKSFQTRDVFTIWGILQLLRLYPGKIPDFELMFQCGDKSVVDKTIFQESSPPPVFHYCGDERTYDIVFPDWTFWGWAELNIRPWETTLHNIQEGNKRITWKDRIPYAFWKGNPAVSNIRKELVKCNISEEQDWNARIYGVHWSEAKSNNFEDTKLENQCTYRYKIYAEGATWSVSEKYIIACDSMTMFIQPRYYDFFTRSMVPLQHYWPISIANMCEDIKFAVDWGNSHPENFYKKIESNCGKHGMSNKGSKEAFQKAFHGSESMACPIKGLRKHFMVESMVMSPSDSPPCSMPPPYTPETLQQFLQENKNLVGKVKTRNVANYLIQHIYQNERMKKTLLHNYKGIRKLKTAEFFTSNYHKRPGNSSIGYGYSTGMR